MTARRDPLTPAWNRRTFLRTGGLTVAAGALVAACGDRGGSTGIPRVGTVPSTTALPTASVTDVALLRTATSLEYNLMFAYEAISALGALSAEQQTIADSFAAHHQEHADAMAALTVSLGGEPFECPNPRLQDVYILPSLLLILGSEAASEALGMEKPVLDVPPTNDPQGDSLTFLHALETLAASTYQALMVQLNDRSLRTDGMTVGAQEAQHSSVWATIINPEQLIATDVVLAEVAPTTTTADTGVPTTEAAASSVAIPVYALPSTFGLLSPVQLQLGAPNESGIRTTLSYETPSLNSLVYEYMGACSV